jgi:hypothetical protein
MLPLMIERQRLQAMLGHSLGGLPRWFWESRLGLQRGQPVEEVTGFKTGEIEAFYHLPAHVAMAMLLNQFFFSTAGQWGKEIREALLFGLQAAGDEKIRLALLRVVGRMTAEGGLGAKIEAEMISGFTGITIKSKPIEGFKPGEWGYYLVRPKE